MLTMPLLLACAYPTAVGLRDDGMLPAPGATELTAHAASAGAAPGFGLQARWGLGERTGIRANVGTAQATRWNAEIDVQVQALEEPQSPVTLTVSAGASAMLNREQWLLDGTSVGLQGGVTVSRTLGAFHPYLGGRINPVLSQDYGYTQAGGGLAWRPRLGEREATFGVETSWYHGFSACAVDPGTDVRWVDCAGWALGIYAGVVLPRPGGG